MKIIFAVRVPFQIVDVIVHLVAVAMIDLRLTVRVRNKSLGDEAMNLEFPNLAIFT